MLPPKTKRSEYMTIENAKKILNNENIAFIETVYASEKDYWIKSEDFKNASFKNAREIKVATLVIVSNNKHKDLTLQFFEKDNQFEFDDLLFGSYSFEMFDYNPNMLAHDLIHNIKLVMSGNAKAIKAYNKAKRISATGLFDISDDADVEDLNNILARIEKKKKSLLGSKKYYDIYDWNTYKTIVK